MLVFRMAGMALDNRAGEVAAAWANGGLVSWPAPGPRGLGPDECRRVVELVVRHRR